MEGSFLKMCKAILSFPFTSPFLNMAASCTALLPLMNFTLLHAHLAAHNTGQIRNKSFSFRNKAIRKTQRKLQSSSDFKLHKSEFNFSLLIVHDLLLVWNSQALSAFWAELGKAYRYLLPLPWKETIIHNTYLNHSQNMATPLRWISIHLQLTRKPNQKSNK